MIGRLVTIGAVFPGNITDPVIHRMYTILRDGNIMLHDALYNRQVADRYTIQRAVATHAWPGKEAEDATTVYRLAENQLLAEAKEAQRQRDEQVAAEKKAADRKAADELAAQQARAAAMPVIVPQPPGMAPGLKYGLMGGAGLVAILLAKRLFFGRKS